MTVSEFVENVHNTNTAYIAMNDIANKYGYRISSAYIQNKKVNINIYKNNTNRFSPEVCFNPVSFVNPKPEFRIQTVSYGSLNMEEYSKFIEWVNNVYKMVKELEKVDTSKLPNLDDYQID